MGERHDFTDGVKALLADRAAHRCSRPDCRLPTLEPSVSDRQRTVRTGRASHICAAAKGGPRYDETQTPSQRRSFENGIWLCARCADVIDKDVRAYPPDLLQSWKSAHDTWLSLRGIIPALPDVTLTTLDGLYVETGDKEEIAPLDYQAFRDHALEIRAASRHELRDVSLRLQLHEGIVSYRVVRLPAGSGVQVRRIGGAWTAIGGAGAPPSWPALAVTVDIERIPPARPLRVILRTVESSGFGVRLEFQPKTAISPLRTYIHGAFLYGERGEFAERSFLVRLREDGRAISSQGVEELGEQELVWVAIA